MYVHVCRHACRHVYGHMYTYVYTHVYRHMYRHMYGHIYKHVHTLVHDLRLFARVACACMRVACACMRAWHVLNYMHKVCAGMRACTCTYAYHAGIKVLVCKCISA